MKRILVMGLPGAGKTTLAKNLVEFLQDSGKTVKWFNADSVREEYNDWDFSEEGRLRQVGRMKRLSMKCDVDFVVCDFIAPLPKMRELFAPDILVWVDTITEGRFDDTNEMFQPPTKYNFRVVEKDADKWSRYIGEKLIEE
jgi:adenylylsulfate kinase